MPERNCDGCKNREEWGCEAVQWREPEPGMPDGPENWLNPAYLPVMMEGRHESYACPRQTLREEPQAWARLLLLYGMYKQGHLPERGAIIDQSHSLLESFRILDDIGHECDSIIEERERLKRGRQGPPKGRR